MLISISPNYENLFSNTYGISSSLGFFKFSTYWFLLFLNTKSTVLSKYFVFIFYCPNFDLFKLRLLNDLLPSMLIKLIYFMISSFLLSVLFTLIRPLCYSLDPSIIKRIETLILFHCKKVFCLYLTLLVSWMTFFIVFYVFVLSYHWKITN